MQSVARLNRPRKKHQTEYTVRKVFSPELRPAIMRKNGPRALSNPNTRNMIAKILGQKIRFFTQVKQYRRCCIVVFGLDAELLAIVVALMGLVVCWISMRSFSFGVASCGWESISSQISLLSVAVKGLFLTSPAGSKVFPSGILSITLAFLELSSYFIGMYFISS